MNKLYALISVAVVLAACSKEGSAPAPAPAPAPAATAPASAPAPAPAPAPAAAPAATPAAAPSASADLPKECQDYLDKVSACISKMGGPSADAIKASMDQTKAAWASYGADKGQLATACKASSDAFAAQASAMKC